MTSADLEAASSALASAHAVVDAGAMKLAASSVDDEQVAKKLAEQAAPAAR